MKNRRFLFIVNAFSRGIDKNSLVKELKHLLEQRNIFHNNIALTVSAEEAISRIKKAREEQVDVVVACGGDGTINTIAGQLVDSQIALGIIPLGSGNGFARALNLSPKLNSALDMLLNGPIRQFDSGQLNGRFFANIAGLGFDAHIAGKFHDSKRRGLATYTKLVLKEFRRYKPEIYRITSGENSIETRSFFTAVCNGSQFGNDFTIAPHANMMDGKLELIDVKKPSFLQAPILALNALQRRFDSNNLVRAFQGTSFTIERENEGLVHIDGEPIVMGTLLHFSVKPSALRVVCRI